MSEQQLSEGVDTDDSEQGDRVSDNSLAEGMSNYVTKGIFAHVFGLQGVAKDTGDI